MEVEERYLPEPGDGTRRLRAIARNQPNYRVVSPNVYLGHDATPVTGDTIVEGGDGRENGIHNNVFTQAANMHAGIACLLVVLEVYVIAKAG